MVCIFTHRQSSIKKSMIYLGNVQNHEERFLSNFVCFSESPNFKSNLKQGLNTLVQFFGMLDLTMFWCNINVQKLQS